MKKLFFYALMASFFTFTACQSDKNNQNVEGRESVGNGINDEIGGSEGGINSDAQGEERLGGEAVGVEDDNTDIENLGNEMDVDDDSTALQQQQQDQY